MIRRIVITVVLFPLVLFLLPITTIYADNAEVLPKGVSRTSIKSKFYLTIDEKFDEDGNEQALADEYNTTLGSGVFPALNLVETTFGMPAGSANIGDSVVSFEYDVNIYEFWFEYGLTDKLSVGIKIPYWDFKTNVDARIDNSNATVGKTAIGTSLGAPIAPLAGPFPDTVPLTTDDVQNFLGNGLDTNGDGTIDLAGFGYDRVENWSGTGISDIEAGVRYQYFKTDNWRLAFTGAIRFPTGEEDDPDSLVDYPLGKDAWAFLFHFNNDYTGIENWLLNATFEYDLVLPHNQVKRVPASVDLPLTSNKEEVEIDPGDRFEFNASATYGFFKGFSLYLYYEYAFTLEDDVSGNLGLPYGSLEEETKKEEHVYKLGLTYSTIPMYKEKKFPLPLTASILYRDRFAGSDNVLKSKYIGLNLAVYF